MSSLVLHEPAVGEAVPCLLKGEAKPESLFGDEAATHCLELKCCTPETVTSCYLTAYACQCLAHHTTACRVDTAQAPAINTDMLGQTHAPLLTSRPC